MTKEDIIRMAREAGFDALLPSEEIFRRGGVYTESDDEISDELERFAHLVAAAERSECVDIVIDNSDMDGICCTDDVLEAIRARGEK